MKLNHIYNEDCFGTMKRFKDNSIDLIITSPPYNFTPRKGGPDDKGKYDVYKDWKEEDVYLDWSINIFKEYERILKENRVILYNFSYSIENPSLPYKLVSDIVRNTNLELVETILWKKKSAMPHPASYNRLTRRWEYFWVFARKDEMKTFKMFKEIVSVRENGQKYYEVFENIVEGKNNDGPCKLNKATYSSEVIRKLITMYGTEEDIIYDSFMGTGTTGVAAKQMKCNYIGSELSKEQCEFAKKRISEI